VIVAGSWIHNPAGEAVLFVKPNGGWVSATQTKRFTAASLGAGDEFGFDVEMTADTVAIGAPLHAAPAANTGGAVFIYNKPTGGWGAPGPALMPAATLSEPATATSNDYFGVALSLRGPLLVVGAFAQSDGVPNAAQGEVFTFQRPAGGWANATASHGLVASDGQLKDRLGYIVATNGHAIFAQASSKNSSAGAVYVFAPPGPTLTNVTQSHRRWRVGTKAPRINAKHHPHGGTTFSFSVSQPAAAKLHFSANGRSKGSLTFAAKAGRNTVWFDGIISTHHKLKPGRATVTISAANANGTPPARTLHFRVKRRPHHH